MKKVVAILVLCLLAIQLPFGVFANADDEASDWARETIEEIKEKELLDERLLGNYRSNISRADFAYLGVKLYEQITGNKAESGDAKFEDSKDSYVLKAKNTGIVNGYLEEGVSKFKPNNEINRAEIAKLFINVLTACDKDIDIKSAKVFKDEYDIPLWARESVHIAKNFSIVEGVGGNVFDPKGKATREQALAMYYRIYKKYVVAGDIAEIKKPLKIGEQVPNFSLSDINGKFYSLESFKGKPAVIVFSTSYDQVSKKLLNMLNESEPLNTGFFSVVNINITQQDSVDKVKSMVEENKISFPVLLDVDGAAVDSFFVSNRPYTFVVDKSGVLIDYELGFFDEKRLLEFEKQFKKM